MADAEDRLRALVTITTLASAGYTALKNTYFSGGVSSWFGGGEVQPLNPELGGTPFEPIQGEPVITPTPTPVPTPISIPKEVQGFSLLTPDQSPTEPFASFGPSGGNFGNSTKKVIDEVLKGATSELPPVDPLTQTPVVGFNASNAFSQPISLPSDAPPLIPPQLQVQVPEIAQNFSVGSPSANISNSTYVPEAPLNPTQGWLESVASYDYSSALTNPYNYLSAMTTYFTLSNIKAAYDNTGITGAVKQSIKEVGKRVVSVYASEAIAEGVAVYLNPGDPIQKEATKQNVKDVIAVTLGVVMPLASLGMSRYRAKNEADRIKRQMEIDRQEELAIEYATSLFRAGGEVDLATINLPHGLDTTVANVMLQHEQQQRKFSHEFADTISKLPDISFGVVKNQMPKDMDFERAMLILMLEKKKRKELVPEVVIKQAAITVTSPIAYTPSAASNIKTNNTGGDAQTQITEQQAAINRYLKRTGRNPTK